MPRSMKVLCLHGWVQSGPTFSKKMGTVQKYLSKFAELHFPTGPVEYKEEVDPNDEAEQKRLASMGADQGGKYGWFEVENFKNTYDSWDKSLQVINEYMKEKGPFDGLIGFSQGAGIGAMLAHLLQPGQPPNPYVQHPPLKFVVFIGGFRSEKPEFNHFYEPKLTIPNLHISGTADTLVPLERSKQLMERCENPNILLHPGMHIVPQQAVYKTGIRDFMYSVPISGEPTKHPRDLTLIVAVSSPSMGIGKKNNMPWHIKEEMGYFANVTTSTNGIELAEGKSKIMNVVLMGRSCYDSIPKKNRPLKERINVVITRTENYNFGLTKKDKVPEHLYAADSIDAALDTLAEKYDNTDIQIGKVFVIGGSFLYGSALYHRLTKNIIFTRIYHEYQCDSFFPFEPKDTPTWEKKSHAELEKFVGIPVHEGHLKAVGSKNEEVELEFELYGKDDVSHALSKLAV
ncbi:dihydrofolate reductase Dfr1 [Schizosaccharomyces cryophilus OY26]|uniref:Dihydrofolate reductase n=1 Tax=Schizosaccharomyces cryophilus (strain OY26 / ATCC MYA-4695 / CBS 11777 / NBRC 106824 / NRRL Y48691) TaxID=653667 RepID=S9W106_SCHCR|nr:dihydrofolate reductase Dfr1 [Schizosaccharomyces cryophilus OY26]EPY52139.1 dihydrofolate reductase Dfr1 [Schizosaccharomyces cryophilus OY26]